MKQELAISSLIIRDVPYIEPLKAIAKHGKFPYIMWHHEMRSDYIYSNEEMIQTMLDLRSLGLKFRDIHASRGGKKFNIWSLDEDQRKASIPLVGNRIMFANVLGVNEPKKSVILHIPQAPDKFLDLAKYQQFMDNARRTLDELEPLARSVGASIDLENHSYPKYVNMSTIEEIIPGYSPEVVNICLDSGHAVQFPGDLDRIAKLGDRLNSLHLNNNDGGDIDQHKLLYSGVLDMTKVAQVVAGSDYDGPFSLEVGSRYHPRLSKQPIEKFLDHAYQDGKRFANVVARERRKLGK